MFAHLLSHPQRVAAAGAAACGAIAAGLGANSRIAGSGCFPVFEQHRPFFNKTIVITGGGGTLGRAGCQYFLAQGANVVIVDSSQAAIDGTLAAIEASAEESSAYPQGKVLACKCDVRDPLNVERMVAYATSTFGRVDHLWNNAGYQGAMRPLLEYPSSDFDLVLAVNVSGAFNVMQACARSMSKQAKGGSIVNTGSAAATDGTPTMCAYVASKSALHGLTLCGAKDLAPHNIRVNTVSPALIGPEDGFMWLRQNRLHAESNSPYYPRDPNEAGKEALKKVPLQRLGTPDEVVRAVAFLLSEDSSYITGANLIVSGGAP